MPLKWQKVTLVLYIYIYREREREREREPYKLPGQVN